MPTKLDINDSQEPRLGFWKSLKNIRAMNRDPISFFQQLRTAHPKHILIPFVRFGQQEAVFVAHSEAIHTVLTAKEFGLAEILMKVLGKQFGPDGPFTTEGETWKTIHRLLEPLFSRDEILRGNKAHILHRQVLCLYKELECAAIFGENVNILDLAEDATMAIACKTIIGAQLTEREIRQCRHDLEAMVLATFRRMHSPLRLLSLREYFATRQIVRRLHALIRQMMASPVTSTFITAQSILQTEYAAGRITESLFFSTIVQLIAASHETTASAITWLSRHLACHPHIYTEKELCREAKNLLERSPDQAWGYRDFPEMTKLITAVLTRYPPIVSVFRSAKQDCSIEINGTMCHIRKGTLLYVPLTHLDEASGPLAAPHPFKTTVFSKGARMCPGAQLALRTLLTYLALVLYNGLRFTIQSENGYQAHLAYKPYELRLSVYRS